MAATFPASTTPLVNPETGLINPPWLLFFAQLSSLVNMSNTMPNYTTAQKTALANVGFGTIVYDITLSKLSVYTATGWQTVTSV